jgi:hypothetical protein
MYRVLLIMMLLMSAPVLATETQTQRDVGSVNVGFADVACAGTYHDVDFKFIKKHVITSGHTYLGIQTATFALDRCWFGCYGDPKILLVTDADFKMIDRHEFDCSLGIVGVTDTHLLSASGTCKKDQGCSGSARLAVPSDELGISIISQTPNYMQ